MRIPPRTYIALLTDFAASPVLAKVVGKASDREYRTERNSFARILSYGAGKGKKLERIGRFMGGASSSLVSSLINGNNLWQTAKNTFTGGLWGGASGFANYEIGSIRSTFLKIAAHSVSEGGMEALRGGHFTHGFLMGLAASAGGEAINSSYTLSAAERIAANAALGGIMSEIGGGKYASGAMTAAYVMMFNELKHAGLTKEQVEMVFSKYEKIKLSGVDFYKSLGGDIAACAAKHPSWFENTCAAKLSKVLDEINFRIPSMKGQTMRGANGMNYFLRAADMRNYFIRIWGAPRLMPRTSKMDYGIVFQNGFSGVAGHVDVFFGNMVMADVFK